MVSMEPQKFCLCAVCLLFVIGCFFFSFISLKVAGNNVCLRVKNSSHVPVSSFKTTADVRLSDRSWF